MSMMQLLQGVMAQQDGASADGVTLSGTTGSPNMIIKTEQEPDATATWRFETDGTVLKDGVQFQSGIQWHADQPSPPEGYYIRAQANAGHEPSGGAGLNFWLSLDSVDRQWIWSAPVANILGSIKVDIATDAAGANIVQTGYYGADIELAEPDEEAAQLSGSLGSPNWIVKGPLSAGGGGQWTFVNNGTLFKDGDLFQAGTQWNVNQPTPEKDYWLRATQASGDAPTTGTLGSWQKIAGEGSAASLVYRWTVTPGTDDLLGIIKVELSTNSAGTNIVATGYYGADIEFGSIG